MCVPKKATREEADLAKSPANSVSIKGPGTPGSAASVSRQPLPSSCKNSSVVGSVNRQEPQRPGDKQTPNNTPAAKSTPAARSTNSGISSHKQITDRKRLEMVAVEPPKKICARRKIDKVRDSRDPEYRTLEPDNSEWDSAKLIKRTDIRKPDDHASKRSNVMSKKKSRVSERERKKGE